MPTARQPCEDVPCSRPDTGGTGTMTLCTAHLSRQRFAPLRARHTATAPLTGSIPQEFEHPNGAPSPDSALMFRCPEKRCSTQFAHHVLGSEVFSSLSGTEPYANAPTLHTQTLYD